MMMRLGALQSGAEQNRAEHGIVLSIKQARKHALLSTRLDHLTSPNQRRRMLYNCTTNPF